MFGVSHKTEAIFCQSCSKADVHAWPVGRVYVWLVSEPMRTELAIEELKTLFCLKAELLRESSCAGLLRLTTRQKINPASAADFRALRGSSPCQGVDYVHVV